MEATAEEGMEAVKMEAMGAMEEDTERTDD